MQKTSDRWTAGPEPYNSGGFRGLKHLCKKISKTGLLKQITELASQSNHDLPLFHATLLAKAWEKLNTSEPAHPRVKSALHWKDLSEPWIQARRLVGIMLWQTHVFKELPIVVNMD